MQEKMIHAPPFPLTEDAHLEMSGIADPSGTEPASVAGCAATDALAPMPWSPLGRLGFRIAFLYFFCFIFLYGNGSLFAIFPVVGNWINSVLTWPMNHLAVWVGHHVFHLTGIAADWHPTGSGDTTLHWILNGLFVVFAVGGGLLWTAIAHASGSRRKEYRRLYVWLRFLLRLTVAMFMVGYGMSKVFPLQMAPISIAILNEPFGNVSPMTLLWAMIGMNPLYETICGLAEVAGGALLLFRHTALAGALFSCFVLANVILYNFFFDVPVKLFAVNLLLASAFLILPDARVLIDFFWRHKPAAPAGIWAPAYSRRGPRIAIRATEIVFTVVFLVVLPVLIGIGWHHTRVAARTFSPMLGAWHMDASQTAKGPFITPEGLLGPNLYVDTVNRAFIRSTDDALWRTNLQFNAKQHTVWIRCFTGSSANYAWNMPDANHLTLTTVPPEKPKGKVKGKQKITPAFTPAVLNFTRTPVPAHYPLLERGFHFVNQWGLER
jgi:hypothetical protein